MSELLTSEIEVRIAREDVSFYIPEAEWEDFVKVYGEAIVASACHMARECYFYGYRRAEAEEAV